MCFFLFLEKGRKVASGFFHSFPQRLWIAETRKNRAFRALNPLDPWSKIGP